jgi:hypothetical protein
VSTASVAARTGPGAVGRTAAAVELTVRTLLPDKAAAAGVLRGLAIWLLGLLGAAGRTVRAAARTDCLGSARRRLLPVVTHGDKISAREHCSRRLTDSVDPEVNGAIHQAGHSQADSSAERQVATARLDLCVDGNHSRQTRWIVTAPSPVVRQLLVGQPIDDDQSPRHRRIQCVTRFTLRTRWRACHRNCAGLTASRPRSSNAAAVDRLVSSLEIGAKRQRYFAGWPPG